MESPDTPHTAEDIVEDMTRESVGPDSVTLSRGTMYLVAGVVSLVVILVVGFYVFNQVNADVVARVNGEPITLKELDVAYASLPPEYRASVDKRMMLDQLVESRVLYQAAVAADETVSAEVAAEEFATLKAESGFTDEQFIALLEAQGMTEKTFFEQYAEQLTVERYLQAHLFDTIVIDDAEVAVYYTAQKASFAVPEQVTVRHILISNENMTDAEEDTLARLLLPELTDDNFCYFVSEYSFDKASVDSCGEYTFSRTDPFVPEFKDLAFSQNVGTRGVVRSQFGPHVIWTVKKTPARTLSLDEVKEDIRASLKEQKGQKSYETFYTTLSADSTIEIYWEDSGA